MTNRKLPSSIIKDIEKHKAAIAMHRDALRNIQIDIETILDSTDSAVQDLEVAIDTLSQYV